MPVAGNLKQITLSSLLHAFPHNEPLLSLPGTSHLVVFTNLDLSSSRLGESSTLAIGPGRTYKTLDEIREHRLGDLPSRFQYPTHFVDLLDPENGEDYEAD